MRGGLVLAGGLSTRMGVRKSLLTLNSKPFIAIITETLLKVADEVVVAIGYSDDPTTYSNVLPRSIRVIKDEVEGHTPLIGILTGLSHMHSTYSAILSCDLPFTRSQVLELLFKRADEFDAAIPQWPTGRIEPLHAIYRVNPTKEAARKAFSSGGLKNTDMIESLTRVNYVHVDEIRPLDPQLLSFFNINIPQDLKKAKKIASKNLC